MATPKASKGPVDAVQAVYEALEPFEEDARRRIIASVMSLLGMTHAPGMPIASEQALAPPGSATTEPPRQTRSATRPISPRELLQEKAPKNNAQKIALFAYYREKAEGMSRFSRRDLEPYFAAAKETPPQNFDRDFTKAVTAGWIHEDGADSYLTSRGLEAVESAFSSESASTPRRQRRASKGSKGRKARRKGTS